MELKGSPQLTEDQINTAVARERKILETTDFSKSAFEVGAQAGREAKNRQVLLLFGDYSANYVLLYF